jgi:multidrug efflux system membrane fusion protein
MTSPRFRPFAAFGLVLVFACAKKDAPKAPPVPVTVATAETRAVPYELAATGTVEPIQTVAVLPQVSGPILRIAFREGQDV